MGDFFAPLLTEEDPKQSTEGTLDPMGLVAIAESLAEKLVPGVRERQDHPRYLTAMAVGLALTEGLGEDRLAQDGVSEPWQVFEWYLVEGLVRTDPEGVAYRLPGRLKARTAIRDGVPLAARTYLKTPSVFGFHGVYRVLARNLGIETDDGLGDLGRELVEVWQKEQHLDGFWGTREGPGASVRRDLLAAIEAGLEAGAVARKGGWGGWRFFFDHLLPSRCGTREAQLLGRALKSQTSTPRPFVLEFLTSPEGRTAWEEKGSEQGFHTKLRGAAPSELHSLLDAILAYERFSRLVQNAFDGCRAVLSEQQKRIAPTTLAGAPGVAAAADQVPGLFEDVLARLEPFGESRRFDQSFRRLTETRVPADWVRLLLEHHAEIQKAKPPSGKAPWFTRFENGDICIRPAYQVEDPPSGGEYVHGFRTRPLFAFARDLGMVQP